MANCQEFHDRIAELTQQIADRQAWCTVLQDQEPINVPAVAACLRGVKTLKERLNSAQEALNHCEASLPAPGIQAAQGRITFLRVHDHGGFGAVQLDEDEDPPEPVNNFVDEEVVFMLDTRPGRAFAFELRNNDRRPSHEGMLASLREALVHDLDVRITYEQRLNRINSIAFVIELRKEAFGPAILVPIDLVG